MSIKITNLALKSIHTNPKNPRNIEDAIGPVAKSIEEFGFLVPLVINKDNTILAGHVRYAAAQALGLKKVPVVKAEDLSPEQEKAFMIADNKVADAAAFNIDGLGELFKELDSANYDVELTGFDRTEIESLTDAAADDVLSAEPNMDLDGEDVPVKEKLARVTFLCTLDQKERIQRAIKDFIGDEKGISNTVALLELIEG